MSIRKNYIIFSNHKVIILILVFLFNIGNQVYSQNKTMLEVKELKSELEGLKGEERARTLLLLCAKYLTFSIDSSFVFAEEALTLSQTFKNDTLIGRSYMSMGFLHMMAGNDSLSLNAFTKATEIFEKIEDSVHLAWNFNLLGQYYYYKNVNNTALAFYTQSLTIYKKLGNPKLYTEIIIVMNDISYVYYDQKDYKQALFYLYNALNIAEAMDDEGSGKSGLFTSIGSIYYDWGQYDKALEYFYKAYGISKKKSDNKSLAYSMNDIGRVYFATGHDKAAFSFYKRAADLFSEVNDNIGISTSNLYIGKYYHKNKKYNTALTYFKTALFNCEQNQQPLLVVQILYEIGSTYYNMNMPAKALENGKKSLRIAKDINNKEYIYKNYLLISDIYSATRNFEEALDYYKLYVTRKDSIYNADMYRQFADAEGKYKADQRQKEIKILKQKEEIQRINIRRQTILRNSLLIGIGLLVALAIVILRSYRQKRKDNLIIAAEKDRSDNLLMNILPEETAEELKKEGFAKTRHYEQVSVLFTDFKGFTAISEKMSPEKLVAELDYCFRAYDMIMEKYNVEKIKTIGDSYMCAAGLPVANTTHPVDIVKCGLEICRFMQDYKKKRMEQNEEYFEVRIGIHTGPVISGIVGTKKFAYDIWGDTVNTASRMETSGVLGAVNISGTTYQYIKDHFKCVYRGKVEAKNKGLIDMYIVECCQTETNN